MTKKAAAGRRYLVPSIAFAIGAALACVLFVYTRDNIEGDALLRFERHAADAKHIIERRLHAYVGVTYGLRALFASRGSLSRIEFHRYVDSLDLGKNFPGFEVLNYARHIPGSERRTLEEEVRADTSLDPRGYPEFAIKPPGDRPEYLVLIYLEPMRGNEFAHGLDIRMMGARGKAMDWLRRADSVLSSGRLISVGKDRFVGLSMRLPVHRSGLPVGTPEERARAFAGTVGAGFNVRKLMSGLLDETTMTSMRYRFYDAGAIGETSTLTLLFDRAQTAKGVPEDNFAPPGKGHFGLVLPLELAGRNWELHFSAPRTAYVAGVDVMLPWLALAAGLLMSALLFAVLYAFASSRARAEALAAEMTLELRQSEAQVRDLLRRLVSAQEAERRRFSADLHDLVGQSLSVLGMGFETIRALLPGALPKKAESTIDHMGRLLKETMGSVRAVMSDLRPPLLDDYGLYAAIEWHAKELEERTGLRVAVEGKDLGARPAAEVETALFRIAQEALTNVARHAGATRARIALGRAEGKLTLVVEDDGRGIAPRAANDPGAPSWGMAVMRERAAAIGGAVRVVSSAGGTRVIVEVASGDPADPR